MGANAQTSVPTFTAGEVLTAANMNISARTGIPVFATTTTRDAAFGGTGEKTLAEGQFCFLEDSNSTLFYDGAAWQAVGTTPGLVCVKAETTASAVSSATADSVFTSTYTNYLINMKFSTSSTQILQIKFRASGTSTSTNYNRQRLLGFGATTLAAQDVNQTELGFPSTNGSTNFAYTTLQISSPQLAAKTLLTSTLINNYGNYTTGMEVQSMAANQNSDTQFDGIEFLVPSGTFTITYSIYGYSKTV